MPPKKPHLFESIDSNLPFLLSEGGAKINFPKGKVFYNPVQQFNRDLSISVIRTFLKKNPQHKDPVIYEGLSATGLRSIRYAKEIPGVHKIYANDLDSEAVKLLSSNVEMNEVSSVVQPNQGDANASLFVLKSKGVNFHIIDLDPYGSAAPFLDSAIQNIANGGLLCITCTDMAVLCASYPETCYAKYSSIPLKGDNAHEAALRIVLSSLESSATKYKRSIKPLLSLSIDFYMRTFVQVFDSPLGSKQACSKKAYYSKCVQCGVLTSQSIVKTVLKGTSTVFSPATITLNSICEHCDSKTLIHGPFWTSPIHDKSFLAQLLEEVKDMDLGTKARIQGMVTVAAEELDIPFFYSLPTISTFFKCVVPPLLDVHSAILNAGYLVSISHTCPTAVKTNAPIDFMWDIFKEWVKKNPVKNNSNQAAVKILESPQVNLIDFSRHSAARPASKASGLTRFQENPTRNWGPLARAK